MSAPGDGRKEGHFVVRLHGRLRGGVLLIDGRAHHCRIGKGGGTINTVLWSHDLVGEPITNVLMRSAYFGGDPPWYKATNTHTWVETTPHRVLRVQTGR